MAILASLAGRARARRRRRRRRTRPRRRGATAALPRHPRRPDRLHLRRRPLHRRRGRRHGPPADQPRRLRDVRPLLARRQADRLHRPVRRQHRGLRHAGRGRRRRAASPTPPRCRATTSPTAWGRTTSSWAGRPTAKRSSSARACASFNDFIGQLYTVSLDGGLPEELPLPRGGFCSYSPDGKKLAYNRVFREFRTWKRYRGGMADDVWIYDFETKKTDDFTAGSRDVSDPDEPAGRPSAEHHPDVERRQDLLPLRPRRPQADEPLRPGRRREEGEAAHAVHRLRREVPVAGRQGDRLRERRLDLPLRPGHGKSRRKCRSAFWRTTPPPAPSW